MNLKLIKTPRLTEKSVQQKELHNQVTFLVDPGANKVEITAVNTINGLGKFKRMGRHMGKRPDYKKAIVTLKAGDKIEYFEGT